MARKRHLLAGIDVGTTKICSVIATIDEGKVRIPGIGWSDSKGLKKGIVVNLTETIDSVRKSLDQAETEARTVVDSAFVSVGGIHIQGLNASGRTDLRDQNSEITEEDIARVIDEAKSLELPEHYEVIHALTQDFTVDGQGDILDPLGLTGQSLSVNLHLVLNAAAAVQNIVNAVNKAGVVVNGVVMQQLASAEAVLTDDEKELGVIVVDIGGGTTDVAFYRRSSVWHSAVLPIGGDLITKDIAIGLKIPLQEAEQLKKGMGNVFPESIAAEELLEISEVGTGRRSTISRRLLCQIIQARCEEILDAVGEIVEEVRMRKDLMTGVVITGGGSQLDGLLDRAEQMLAMPVRIGYPINLDSIEERSFDPAYATAIGLLRYGKEIQNGIGSNGSKSVLVRRPKATTERLKEWVMGRIS